MASIDEVHQTAAAPNAVANETGFLPASHKTLHRIVQHLQRIRLQLAGYLTILGNMALAHPVLAERPYIPRSHMLN